jgi:hypothetical protein
MVLVLWFAEDETVTFGDSVGGEDQRGFRVVSFGLRINEQLLANSGRFTVGEVSDETGGAEVAADAAFHIFGRRDYGELKAGVAQQLASSR